jgi:hypothetical protein
VHRRRADLLPRHRDPEPLVGVDVVVGVLGVVAQIQLTQLTVPLNALVCAV